MRRLALIALLAGLTAAPALAADPVEGIWKTRADDNGNFGHVRLYACEDNICGVIAKAFDSAGNEVESENVGKRMIWNMEAQGGGDYANGSIWAPDRDRIYRSKMSLDGNSLSVAGCVAGGLICRDQVWTRVE